MSDAESLVKDYLTIRREREKLKEKYESEDNTLKEALARIESALLDICNQTGANGLKTTHGSVSRQIKDRFFCTDWDNFKKFVETEGSIDLLERRIHQKNFKEFMSGREGMGLPPGVNSLREYDIVVRKVSSNATSV